MSKIKNHYFDELLEVDDNGMADYQMYYDQLNFKTGNPSPINEGTTKEISWDLSQVTQAEKAISNVYPLVRI